MDVRVMVQVLSPGVQHHQDADRGTEALGIGSDFAQRAGGAAHEQIVEDGGVGEGDLAEFSGQGEHHMMVFDRQEVLRLLIEPVGASQGLALGTVAVAARVVGNTLMAAIEAVLDVAAQDGSTAVGQFTQRLALRRGTTSRSSRLGVCWRRCVLTCK